MSELSILTGLWLDLVLTGTVFGVTVLINFHDFHEISRNWLYFHDFHEISRNWPLFLSIFWPGVGYWWVHGVARFRYWWVHGVTRYWTTDWPGTGPQTDPAVVTGVPAVVTSVLAVVTSVPAVVSLRPDGGHSVSTPPRRAPPPITPGTTTPTPVPALVYSTLTVVLGVFTRLLLVTTLMTQTCSFPTPPKTLKNMKNHEISHFRNSETTTLRHLNV